jgi:hypothetical protein
MKIPTKSTPYQPPLRVKNVVVRIRVKFTHKLFKRESLPSSLRTLEGEVFNEIVDFSKFFDV